MEDINGRWPALIPGLVNHEGISFVAVMSTEHGPLVVGPSGLHRLSDDKVTGEDPLAPFGPLIPADLLRAVSMPEAPDLYVNSSVDQDTGEVSAFEGLVGCHGGLGGRQGRAFLLAPPDLAVPDQQIRGADELHRVLVGYLEQLGQRGGISRDGATSYHRRTGGDSPTEDDQPARPAGNTRPRGVTMIDQTAGEWFLRPDERGNPGTDIDRVGDVDGSWGRGQPRPAADPRGDVLPPAVRGAVRAAAPATGSSSPTGGATRTSS